MLILLLSLLVILIIILKNKKIETFQNINYNQIILSKQKINKIKYDYEKIKLVYEENNKNPLVLFEIKNNKISILKKKEYKSENS